MYVQVRVATSTKKKVLLCSVRDVPASVDDAVRLRPSVCTVEFTRMEKLAPIVEPSAIPKAKGNKAAKRNKAKANARKQ